MSPQIFTDDKGKKIGVFLPYKEYEKLMRALENAADERAYDRAMRQKEETIPLREAIKLRKEKIKQKNDKV